MINLQIGKTPEGQLELSTKVLQRHFACFGSSGSGKTVACKVLIEELARRGIPVIAFDPQGDIASLAVMEDAEKLKKRSLDPTIRDEIESNVEVVIWTPSSSKGIPLCINPLQFEGMDKMTGEDRTRYLASTAKNISSLIGYDLDSDDGKSAESVLSTIFDHSINNNTRLNDFGAVISILQDIPKSIEPLISSISTSRLIKELTKKLSLLTVGTRKLLFQSGVPASIESLLGLNMETGKTRVSVIYLNSLASSEEKEFFIGSIAQLIYQWMLKNPPEDNLDSIQCAMFIDEIAPYIPPVQKPACKTNLELLFRQGRKYGVSCIIATQSPGDIDYKAIGQFSTIALGVLNTEQDIKKVRKRVESMAPKEIEYIIKKIPALKPGQFLLISPDEFDKVQHLQVRWLATRHPLVISEDKIEPINSDEIKEYYLDRINDTIDNEVINVDKSRLDDEDKNNNQKMAVSHTNGILCVENKLFERDLLKAIKPHLKGTVFKSEELDDAQFEYLPLIQVKLIYLKESGLLRKNVKEIPENLYLHYKTMDLLYIERAKIKFSAVVDIDPNKIVDLDNICEIVHKDESQIDFDRRKLGRKKMDINSIKNNMERKYRVKVSNVELVLFPIWKCTIKNKKNNTVREINIDGIFSNIINENKINY